MRSTGDRRHADPRARAVLRQAVGAGAGGHAPQLAGAFDSTALVCITLPAAMGAMRALYERGLKPGKDMSLCSANDEGLAAFLCPSLTAVQMPDPLPYLTLSMEWMGGKDHVGPLLSRPDEASLFIGESTGPAPVN